MTLCLEGLIIIAGVVAIALLAAILGCIGYGISKIASYSNYKLFILAFAAPAGPILVLYLIVSLLIFSPTAYIMANNDGISAGETIGTCYRSMINNGKMTVFLSYFVSGLLRLLYLAPVAVGGYFLFKMVIPAKYFTISLIGYSLVTFCGYIAFAPILTLVNRVVKDHLFEDIVLDPVTAARINEKVNLSVCNGQKLNGTTSKNLESLFEYTEDPYRIMEKTEKKSQRIATTNPKKSKKKVKREKAVAEEPAEAEDMPDTVEEYEETAVIEPTKPKVSEPPAEVASEPPVEQTAPETIEPPVKQAVPEAPGSPFKPVASEPPADTAGDQTE